MARVEAENYFVIIFKIHLNLTALPLGILHSNITSSYQRRASKTEKLGKYHDDNGSHRTNRTSLQPGNCTTNFLASEYAEAKKEQAAHLQAKKQPCRRR